MTDPFKALKAQTAADEAAPPVDPAALAGSEDSMPARRPEFFAAVRKRGLLNTMMTTPEQEYLKRHPEHAVRWEHAPANGDTTLVTAREAYGFHVVDASEIVGDGRGPHKGPIRRGDAIMMAAPKEVAQELLDQDARAAREDLRSPESAFYDSLRKNKVRTRDGDEHIAVPTGNIRAAEEIRSTILTKEGDIKLAPREGGE